MWTSNGRAGDGGAYVSLRGFVSANSLRNGVLGAVTGTIDAINLEKIEVLKGPSGTYSEVYCQAMVE
jgi:iron complex outermembrane receptor protein